jgi:anaphase-promoting complex subunit 1
VNARSKDVVTLYAILYGREEPGHLLLIHDYVRDLDWAELASTSTQKPLVPVNMVLEPGRRQAAAVLKMSSFGWNLDHVEALPAGIGLPLRHALFRCQLEPGTDWPDEAYRLINRLDMCQCPAVSFEAASLLSSVPELNLKSEAQRNKSSSNKEDSAEDGMEDVVELPLWKMLFPRDHRIQEVRRLLCSSRPVAVVLPASTLQGLSEHELIEEREKHLLALCIRIMALPVGRGMFTLHTATPTVTETLSIPRLDLFLIKIIFAFMLYVYFFFNL